MIKKIIDFIISLFKKKKDYKPEYIKTDNREEWSAVEKCILKELDDKRITSLIADKACREEALKRLLYQYQQPKITHSMMGVAVLNLRRKGFEHVGEILAYGYPSCEDVIRGWLNSESHYSIIIDSSYKYVGVAHGVHKDKNYYCVLFVK